MNDILELKGSLKESGYKNYSRRLLPKYGKVSSNHIIQLERNLEEIKNFWEKNNVIDGALVSVHYSRVIAKTNRISCLLEYRGCTPSESIRGSKFKWESDGQGNSIQKHVFTHYIPISAIQKTIDNLLIVERIVEEEYEGVIDYELIKKISEEKKYRSMAKYGMFLNKFVNIIIDCWNVEYFAVDTINKTFSEKSIITIYETNVETKKLLEKFGIKIFDTSILDKTTLRLNPDDINILVQKAPYLISMGVSDLSEISNEDLLDKNSTKKYDDLNIIPSPHNEPIVGVIDTQFDDSVYFHKWVDYKNCLDPEIEILPKDKFHGTAVTSIIVDGPRGNPDLNDGCGNFRVRHFGVATAGNFSSFSILRDIRKIVKENRDIKVWNLSLGSRMEIEENFISPEAAELDRIQHEYDVIFIVAGTNVPLDHKQKQDMKIGAPADSLNSIVVNSVDFNNHPASYTRVGPVLSFFYKPDVSYYGGDGNSCSEKIVVCRDSFGAYYAAGTSFAAPWVTRKIAYLIYIMGLTKEAAKALLIDASAGWKSCDDCSCTKGYGVVPIHINDIIKTPNDEIRFILTGISRSYETYSYQLPIPQNNSTFPFYARATLAYFPYCDRNQGVDYTSTEMDLHFGRIKDSKKGSGKLEIKPINNNKQGDEGLQLIYEENARKQYRKWDNVKHICEEIKQHHRPRKAYNKFWGISIRAKERIKKRDEGLPFAVVITLKEMNGKNRIDEFIKLCQSYEWRVHRLNVENKIELFNEAEEEVTFD